MVRIVKICQKWFTLSTIVKNYQNCQKLSKFSKKNQIVKKFQKFSKLSKNCQNFQKIVKIVKMLVRSCFLITVIKYLKGHWSLGSLFNVKKQKVAH